MSLRIGSKKGIPNLKNSTKYLFKGAKLIFGTNLEEPDVDDITPPNIVAGSYTETRLTTIEGGYQITLPTHQVGDLILIIFVSSGSYGTTGISMDNDYNHLAYAGRTVNDSSYYSSLTVFTKVAGASEPNPTISSQYTPLDSCRVMTCVVRNHDGLDTHAISASNVIGDKTTTSPIITTTRDNDLLISVISTRLGIPNITNHTILGSSTVAQSPGWCVAYHVQPIAGISTATTFEDSGSQNLYRQAQITIGIKGKVD